MAEPGSHRGRGVIQGYVKPLVKLANLIRFPFVDRMIYVVAWLERKLLCFFQEASHDIIEQAIDEKVTVLLDMSGE